MQILIPISHDELFFPKSEFYFPKPLIDVHGKPMIVRVIENFKANFENPKFIFIVDKVEISDFSLDDILKQICGASTIIIERLGKTSGAVCSSLLAIDYLNESEPLLISNCDTILRENLQKICYDFIEQNADIGVINFNSCHPRWAYIARDEKNIINQAYEKKVVSNEAISGFYWYRNAEIFINAAKSALLNSSDSKLSFFLSATINEAILIGKSISSFSITNDKHHNMFSPKQIDSINPDIFDEKKVFDNRHLNLVIPAAGEGSRFFKAGWKKPKPFLDIGGKSMLQLVSENLTFGENKPLIICRSEDLNNSKEDITKLTRFGAKFVNLKNVTGGTAITILAARNHLDETQPLLVGNSDQLIDFDVEKFVNDCIERNLDGSILVFKDIKKDPKWSYAALDENNLVCKVAEKEPISEYATVGIYLFRKAKDFYDSCLDMIIDNAKVNGEFYTCPVYNYMIEKGAKIGIYEIESVSMHGLGTPEDFQKYLKYSGRVSLDEPN